MGQASTHTVTAFTGMLLQRHRAPGRPFAQLVFREAGKNHLCLSSNLTQITRLQIGKTYKIEGVLKSLGERSYVHEPKITPAGGKLHGLKRWGVYTTVVLMVASATAFAVRSVHGNLAPTSADTVKTQSHDSGKSTNRSDAKPAQTEQATTPASEVSATAPAPAPTTQKKTATAPAPAPTPTAPVAVAPAPTPHCDAPVTTTLQAQVNEDPSQPVGHENITQQNIDRVTQVCYPDAGTANGTTTVIQEGQPQIKTVGTGTTPDPTV